MDNNNEITTFSPETLACVPANALILRLINLETGYSEDCITGDRQDFIDYCILFFAHAQGIGCEQVYTEVLIYGKDLPHNQ